jgi:hypothetical protein
MRKMILQCGVLALSLVAANVMAAVSPQEAAKLGTTLTPVGAEKAGNADGSIPAWTGGIPKKRRRGGQQGLFGRPVCQ